MDVREQRGDRGSVREQRARRQVSVRSGERRPETKGARLALCRLWRQSETGPVAHKRAVGARDHFDGRRERRDHRIEDVLALTSARSFRKALRDDTDGRSVLWDELGEFRERQDAVLTVRLCERIRASKVDGHIIEVLRSSLLQRPTELVAYLVQHREPRSRHVNPRVARTRDFGSASVRIAQARRATPKQLAPCRTCTRVTG